MLRRFLRAGRRGLVSVAALVSLYLCAAFVLGRIPLNRNADSPGSGIPVYLMSNGVHIDLVLPVTGPCPCDRQHAPTLDLLEQSFSAAVPRERWHWLAVGWGDAAFMLTVPTWNELTPGVALRAASGLDASVVRISSYHEPSKGPSVRMLMLTAAQYRALLDYVGQSLVRPLEERRSAMAGPEDRFYLSQDRYSIFFDCNAWVGRGLARAGVRAPLWTPFAGPLLQP